MSGQESSSANTQRVPPPPLVVISSSWLDGLTNRIRSRPIPWEGYARADLVSQDELKMIRSVDAKDAKEVDGILDERGEQYAILYLRLLSKLSRTDTLQQVLVLIADMVEANPDRAQLFSKAAKTVNEMEKEHGQQDSDKQAWPWAPVVKLLDVSDDFVQVRAAHFLATLLVAPGTTASSVPSHVLPRLLSFLATLINGRPGSTPASAALQPTQSPQAFADGNGADIAIQLLEGLLRNRSFRRAVWDDEMKRLGSTSNDEEGGQTAGILRGLVYILQNAVIAPGGARAYQEDDDKKKKRNDQDDDDREESGSREQSGSRDQSGSSSSSSRPSSPVSAQLQYRVLINFWLLSFSPSIASELNRKFAIVALLVDALRGAVKEKVMRVCVATLANLLAKAPDANASAMLGSGLLPHVELMAERYRRIDAGGSSGNTQSGGADEEMCEDIEYLSKELRERWNGMSNFDAYLSELESGKLTWNNPAHELDDFWRQNAQKMLEKTSSSSSEEQEDENGEDGEEEEDTDNAALRRAPNTPLKRLLVLVSTSQDATTLAVACNDLGKIIQFTDVGGTADSANKQHQQQQQEKSTGGTGAGRKRISEWGGKLSLMRLMSHENNDVKYRALQTVGKLMSQSWR